MSGTLAIGQELVQLQDRRLNQCIRSCVINEAGRIISHLFADDFKALAVEDLGFRIDGLTRS